MIKQAWKSYKARRFRNRINHFDKTRLGKLIDESAFPTYIQYGTPGQEQPAADLSWSGRVFMHARFATRDPDTMELLDTIRSWGQINPADVLHIPLYRGNLNQAPSMPEVPLVDYELNLAFLKTFAPHVGGILVGNQGAELGYRHITSDPRQNIHLTSKFIQRVGEIVRDAGGVPFFAPMDWDIIADCYQAGCEMLDTLNEVGATAICCCGYSMFEDAYCDRENPLTHDQPGVIRGFEGQDDPEILKSYLHHGNFWTGLSGRRGLAYGNDRILSEAGFAAGFMSTGYGYSEEEYNALSTRRAG